MKISIATDHGAFELKNKIKDYLESIGHEVTDFGCFSNESVDYPPIIAKAARAVSTGKCERGIVLCGSGIGASIVANKIKGIRCALVYAPELAKLSREHNNANMIALGGRFTDFDTAKELVDIFLTTEFQGGRHLRRVEQIMDLEKFL
ncbi:sugar-phosphate isomerase, RpiB/LacA/LacB family [Thermodesulfobium narugense DSM 14796]|uniref:Sugar-phosphate isomerase, RpiB/LacA/LacB family n=1 Tax=Thermodesulfobium narugense DSM 14796 TaxID=747365 RepID=M1E4E5_9BACT|nr:ribose 5-phosphate isomerase B [Thermodesulfobium narugense]AEE14072.1 sugar-phosphate isomerase, RpiB/LacA/LacB family [Thermodesulfobium narugense DSM 14796]